MLQKLAQFTDIRVALIVGGLSLQVQAATLRSRPEIIVATPVSKEAPPLSQPALTWPHKLPLDALVL